MAKYCSANTFSLLVRGLKWTVVVAMSFSLPSVIPTAGAAVFTIAISSILSTLVTCCCRLFHLIVAKEAVVKHNSYNWSWFSVHVNGHCAFGIYRRYGDVSGECNFSRLITLHSSGWNGNTSWYKPVIQFGFGSSNIHILGRVYTITPHPHCTYNFYIIDYWGTYCTPQARETFADLHML